MVEMIWPQEVRGSNPTLNSFLYFLFNYSFGVHLHKYKFQVYYFKLVHCGVVVTTRALYAQGIGFHSGPGSPPNFLP